MPSLNDKIHFHFVAEPFDFSESKVREWLIKIIKLHERRLGELGIIFCSDDYLLSINKNYLGHDYYTDIITFPMDADGVSGELYISIDRVKENANNFRETFQTELLRVIIHGVLHLMGFGDKSDHDKKEMTRQEDFALKIYFESFAVKDHYFDWVYDAVRCIPKGRVSTYGAIADYLTLGSARMVGWALNQLKGHIIDVPAHRVVNAKGELSGRMMFGEGGSRMAKLLKQEGVPVENDKVVHFEKYFWHPKEMGEA